MGAGVFQYLCQDLDTVWKHNNTKTSCEQSVYIYWNVLK